MRRTIIRQLLAAAAVLSLAAGLCLVAGCTASSTTSSTSQPESSTSVTAAPTGDAASQIEQILALNRSGQLSDAATAKLLEKLSGSAATRAADWAPTEAVPEVSPAPAAVAATGGLPAYQAEKVLRGRLRSVGSDTMDKLMELWAEGFKKYHPQMRFYHQGKGSSTAPPALMEGQSEFGPMSRKIKDKEVDQFKTKFGYEPLQFPVAVDALAVYVHPSNPIAEKGLNFQQLDAIFGSSRKRGASENIVTWGQLGLTGEWANAPIHVYSRNSASGTYGVFKDLVLQKGDYKTTNKELVGSAEVVAAVVNDPYGIGYSGIGYKVPNVATPPLCENPGGTMRPPTEEYASNGEYPLARSLFLTINHKPGTPANDLHREFMKYVYSAEGQALVTKDGFFPVSPKIAAEQLAKLLGPRTMASN